MAAPAAGDVFEPIAGVELAMFAQISAGLAQCGYDQTKAVGIAAAQGIDSTSWQAALDGWNQRIAANPVVAQRFNALCVGAGVTEIFKDYRTLSTRTGSSRPVLADTSSRQVCVFAEVLFLMLL